MRSWQPHNASSYLSYAEKNQVKAWTITLEKYNNQCIPDTGHHDNPCSRHWGNPVTTGTSGTGRSSTGTTTRPIPNHLKRPKPRQVRGFGVRALQGCRILARMAAPLRVTLCPVNTAGVPWANAEALRRRGVDARLVVFERYKLHPEADESLDIPSNSLLLSRQARQWAALARLLPRTDVFHFHFGLTLVPQSLQFPILRAARKKSVMHYLGSDIRGKTPERARVRQEGGRPGGRQLRRDPLGAGGRGDPARHRPRADRARCRPSDRARPLIVHAPSSRRRKGSEHVVAAVEGLDADLELVEGLHHDEAFERYRAADIVVDQLNAGWYGLFAIEAMALGKPVVTFLHDEAVRRTEEAFGTRVPIVSATAETLRETLRPLVADAARRRELGAASRAYVERVHDLERVTDRLLDLYARL